jgi:DNA-binding NarL/FixJ family response regulator
MDNRRSQPIRIVIADDHPIFRDGLRRLLEAEADLKVIGEASDGAEAVKLARQLKPDILLLDLAMPRNPGLEALRELSSGSTNSVRVILLTAAAEKNQIVEALQLGARGVVLKDSATPTEKHSYSYGWRILGGARKCLESGAIPQNPGAIFRRRSTTKEIWSHAARNRNRISCGCWLFQ